MSARLALLQRGSALILFVFIIIHLVTIFYASHNGLSADEILERLRGHMGWLIFYSLFSLLIAIHGAIGLRVILREWTPFTRISIDYGCWFFLVLLLALGLRATVGLVLL